MTTASELMAVPVLTPMRLPAKGGYEQHRMPGRDIAHPWKHRLYRMPPHYQKDAFSYGKDAHIQKDTPAGGLINLYV